MEYYEVAAKWWADKLRNVGPGHFNNGDDSSTGGIGMMLATMLASKTQASNEKIDLFEKKLAETIKEEVEDRDSMTLSVDYGPDRVLGRLAEECAVSTNGFPWKTTMWIDKENVSVSSGYRSPEKTIFPIEST